MFGLFSSPSISDPDFGELKRSRGMWRGRISSLGQIDCPLVLAGSKNAPDPIAMRLAKSIASRYPSWQPVVAKELVEHLAPYAEAVAAGELPAPEGQLPTINQQVIFCRTYRLSSSQSPRSMASTPSSLDTVLPGMKSTSLAPGFRNAGLSSCAGAFCARNADA